MTLDVRRNELAFERAARDYYLVQTGKRDWPEITPEMRAYYRHRLAAAANEIDEWIFQQVAENEKALPNKREGQ